MSPWRPTSIQRVIRTLSTSTYPVHVETDAGEGILKVINNPQGEHALAKDWIGTQLAQLLGLPTYDAAVIQVTADDDVALADGRKAKVGPALILRYEKGATLGGGTNSERNVPHILAHVDNPSAIASLVVFDTWVLNRDRYGPDSEGPKRRINRDNVWASREDASKEGFVLKSIDHSECFTLGRDISPKIASIEYSRFAGAFGLFPEFRSFLNRPESLSQRQREVEEAVASLRKIRVEQVTDIVNSIPSEWQVDGPSRAALVSLLIERARYVSDNVSRWIWPEQNLPF
jgi:hypothetical protein